MRLLIEAANAAVAIEGGYIVEPSGRFDRVIDIREGEIRPSLINAHDHLHRNHYGRLGAPPYTNAYDWAADIQTHFASRIAQGRQRPRREALLWGAWKNLLSGVTHVVHHDPWEADFDLDFPINVVRISNADSIGRTPDFRRPENGPYALHVAEGTDPAAAQEVHALQTAGFLTRDLLAVHLVGPDADGMERLRACGCAMVWCPTSNYFLFGRTAPDALFADGMDILLGSDSLLTGAGTLLDELHIASRCLPLSRVLGSVGSVAARRLAIAEPTLEIGTIANLAIFRRPVPHAELADVALVIAKGKLRVLDPEFLPMAGVSGERTIEWRGVRRWIDDGNTDLPIV